MSEATSQISDDRRETLPDQGGADRPKARSVKPLALLWPYVRKHLTLVFVALFFLVVSTMAALSIPWLFGRAVDAGAVGHVFNLGHGVLPGTDPEVITDAVALVHEL